LRRPAILALLLAILASGLAGCAGPPREDICRRILDAVLPANAEPKVEAVEADPLSSQGVVLRFTTRETGIRLPEQRHLLCAFAPSSGDRARFGLVSVEIDGRPLSRVKLILLHRWLGQEVPPILLEGEAPPPWPLGLHLAYLVQQVINGIVAGSVLALIAAGYTLVYGVTRHLQFAFGGVMAIGAMMASLTYLSLGLAGWHGLATAIVLGLPFAIAVGALTGFWMQHVAFGPLWRANTQSALIAAIGMSLFLEEFLRLSQGGRERWLPALLPGKHQIFVGGGFDVIVTNAQIGVVILAVALSSIMAWILSRSRLGRSYRATADDPRMAALLGVDCGRVVAVAYTGGAALAAAAGVALLVHYGEAGAQSGLMIGFKALTAALLGGIGSFQGALLGGLLIGLFEALWAGYIDAAWRDAAVFTVLVLVLVFRPAGLLGHADAITSAGPGGGPGSALRSHPTAPPPASSRPAG
jgi:branched-chain amino acid transport system permease protein